jgi:hypothetical protein
VPKYANVALKRYYSDITKRFEDTFDIKPTKPNFGTLSSPIQERMMRLELDVHRWGIDRTDQDALVMLAHHTLLEDQINSRDGHTLPEGMTNGGPWYF